MFRASPCSTNCSRVAFLARQALLQRSISSSSTRYLIQGSPNAHLSKTLLNRFKCLPIPKNMLQATYLWIDGTGENIRGKDRILNKAPKGPEDLPEWSYDGSSCYQAQGDKSDLLLIPQSIYRDPFNPQRDNILVMCETFNPDCEPTKWNIRAKLREAEEQTKKEEPMFGIEQEYTLLGPDSRPFGWPKNGYPAPQGPYYCGVGGHVAYGRDIEEAHTMACLFAGISFFGTNAEVLPSQWEYQVGPAGPLKVSDDIWVSRYILKRIAESYGLDVTFDPKPIPGQWNGSGAHTNFSTKQMREDGGLEKIKDAIKLLEARHNEHIIVYDPKGGKDNVRRLGGTLETSDINKFTWGMGDRNVSVRVPLGVSQRGKGYLEDRRPAANCDPYAVCNAIIRTCLMCE